ncbi:MAG: hypothetical protein DRJ97_08225 [Thermoprotei archaeon]|nr:MAG: hypothetical protein DRJ97_08225 [Thermoprotei archaeon]
MKPAVAELADILEREAKRYVVVRVDAVKLQEFGYSLEAAGEVYPEVVKELKRRGLHVIRNPWGAGFIVADDREVLRQIERSAKRVGLEAALERAEPKARRGLRAKA